MFIFHQMRTVMFLEPTISMKIDKHDTAWLWVEVSEIGKFKESCKCIKKKRKESFGSTDRSTEIHTRLENSNVTLFVFVLND